LPELISAGGLTGMLLFLWLALARSWLWTNGQVERMLTEAARSLDSKSEVVAFHAQRAEDFRAAYASERERADRLTPQLDRALGMLEILVGRDA
jgi:hypothetical protein